MVLFLRGRVDFLVLTFMEFRLLEHNPTKCVGLSTKRTSSSSSSSHPKLTCSRHDISEFRLLEKKCSGRYLVYRKQYNFLLKYSDFFLSMLFQVGLCMVAILKPTIRWKSNKKETAYHSGAPDYTPDVSSCCLVFSFLCIFFYLRLW